MVEAAIQVLLYGLLAGLSPLALAATLAVMPAGRLKVLGFAAGFVIAQTLVCSVLVIIGVAATGSSPGNHAGLRAGLEIALALALIALALRLRRGPVRKDERPEWKEQSDARRQALVARLGRLRFITTVFAGFVLGIGGPKRLVLTSLAATTIVAADLADGSEALLVVLYVALATALVWGPATLFLILGGRAVTLMERVQSEAVRRQPQATVYALLVLAVFLIVDAVGALLI